MFSSITLLAVLLNLYVSVADEQVKLEDPRNDIIDKTYVSGLLAAVEFKEGRTELIRVGVRAFPVYESLLDDQTLPGIVVARIYGIIGEVKADRRRFIERAIRHLAHDDVSIRRSAVALLGKIGSRSDASPIVALLWDEDVPVVRAAAETLSEIGGERELAALDLWIKSSHHRNAANLRRNVQLFRDILQRRVEEEKKKIIG